MQRCMENQRAEHNPGVDERNMNPLKLPGQHIDLLDIDLHDTTHEPWTTLSTESTQAPT